MTDTPAPGIVGAGLPRPVGPPIVPAEVAATIAARTLETLKQISADLRRLTGGDTTVFRTFAQSIAVGGSFTFKVDVPIDHWHVWVLGAQTDRWSFSLSEEAPGAAAPVCDGRGFLQAPGHTRVITVLNISGSTQTFYLVAEAGVDFSVGQL